MKTYEYLQRLNKDRLHEFIGVVKVLSDKMDELTLENEKLRTISGKSRKYIIEKNGMSWEFKKLKDAAEYIGVYPWELDEMIKTGDEYNGYTADFVE